MDVKEMTDDTIIFYILLILRFQRRRKKEKNRSFECGFDPVGRRRLQFCMKFFLLGIIFLIFDVEISLILPLPYRQTFTLSLIFVLFIGLCYEWQYGGLDWMVYVNRAVIRHSWCSLFGFLAAHMNES